MTHPEVAGKLQKVKVKSLSHVPFSATPWTVAYQAPPSMGFSRQEYWSGLPFPSPRHCQQTVDGGSPMVGMIFPLISIWLHPQLAKPSQAAFHGWNPCPLQWPTPCRVLWILTNQPLTYHCVSHWVFAMSFIRSWSQASWVLVGLKSQERGDEGWEEKAVGKTCQGIPFIACQKIC